MSAGFAVRRAGAGCAANRTTETFFSQARIEFSAVAQSAFAAQHNVSARRNLSAKAKIATPPGGGRKQLWQPAMLNIGKPRDRRQRQTPAKKAGVFEDKIDAFGLKFRRSRLIETEHKRPSQARTASVKDRRLHDFNIGDL